MIMNRIILLLILLSFIYPASWLNAVELKSLKSIQLKRHDNIFIEKADSFIVTEDKRILVTDSKAANIKIFDMNGNRVSIFGRRGVGPNEFLRPRLSDYNAPYVAIMDFGRKSVFLYKRLAGDRFEFADKFLCLDMANDFHLIDSNTIMITTDTLDSKGDLCSLHTYNFKENKYDYILPSMIAYGYTSKKKHLKDHDGRLSYIGASRTFDVSEESIFFAWTAEINIFKINRKTKRIEKKFGRYTENFVKPGYTPEIKRAFHQHDHRMIYKLQRKMSYVRDVFVSEGNVGIVYVGPFTEDNRLSVMLQLYTKGGEFLKETRLLYAQASHHYEVYFYFNKFDNTYYILDTETSDKFDQFYKIYPYKLEE